MNERAAVEVSASDDALATEDEAGLAFFEAFCADSLASDEDTQRLSDALDQLSSAARAGALPNPSIQAALLAQHATSPGRKQDTSAPAKGMQRGTASVGKSSPIEDIDETLARAGAMLSDEDHKKALLKKFIEERRTRAETSDQDRASGAMQANAVALRALQAIQSRQAGTTLPLETVRNV